MRNEPDSERFIFISVAHVENTFRRCFAEKKKKKANKTATIRT